MGSYLFVLLILICPLMMFFMMRGMRGGNGDNAEGGQIHNPATGDGRDHTDSGSNASLEELQRQRQQLDREIEEREAQEQSLAPVGGGHPRR